MYFILALTIGIKTMELSLYYQYHLLKGIMMSLNQLT